MDERLRSRAGDHAFRLRAVALGGRSLELRERSAVGQPRPDLRREIGQGIGVRIDSSREIDPRLRRGGREPAGDFKRAAMIGERFIIRRAGWPRHHVPFGIPVAGAGRFDRRGARRLSGASLSRDRSSRHLDGPLARDSGGAAQSAEPELRRAAGAGRRRALPLSRAGRAYCLGGDARARLPRRARLRGACGFLPRACPLSAVSRATSARSPRGSTRASKRDAARLR